MTKKRIQQLLGGAAIAGIAALGYLWYEHGAELGLPGAGAPKVAETSAGGKPATSSKTDGDTAQTAEKPATSGEDTAGAQSEAVPDSAGSGDKVAEAAVQPEEDEGERRLGPTFDVFRVEPSGDAVVAGRSEAGAIIALLSNGEVVGKGIANDSGEFAIVLDKPLKPGTHDVKIESKKDEKAEPVVSEESIAVSIPDPAKGKGEVLVVLNKPGEATEILQKPEDTAPDATGEQVAASSPDTVQGGEADAAGKEAEDEQVALATTQSEEGAEVPPTTSKGGEASSSEEQGETAVASIGVQASAEASGAQEETSEPGSTVTVEAVETEKDKVFVAGQSEPGSDVRVYVDNELVGEAKADKTGRWLLEGSKKIEPGKVDVRADKVESSEGEVTARAEVTFERTPDQFVLRPISVSAQGSGSAGGAAQGSSGPIPSVIIRRGDNLWTISRRLYGEGLRYTTIYQANQQQIRNPDLIYPGQVFVLPVRDKAWKDQSAN
ncbi:LysM peptidoglycan-binding domain-containing protein [Stappia sp. GBMRC 2046]|uniref:LysM peptidoglycan-binding domain-containing protein n=1 Tax=Stappia sediminis TaxID=2692190 RepID=A0A7X3LSK0_9HYPH|nr:Ig-like domain-containing protein [Stappia sediminis]MXN64314.1 LysM peptidoglycan-binding domain-containing protein [Stappia sediminis]